MMKITEIILNKDFTVKTFPMFRGISGNKKTNGKDDPPAPITNVAMLRVEISQNDQNSKMEFLSIRKSD